MSVFRNYLVMRRFAVSDTETEYADINAQPRTKTKK